jgi:hypothetical protein
MKSFCIACPACDRAYNLKAEAPERVGNLNSVRIACACGRMFDAEPVIMSVVMYRVVRPEVRQ